jgi:hypothetical protein
MSQQVALSQLAPLDADQLEKFIIEFYAQADDSAPLAWFLPYIDDSLYLEFTSACKLYGPAGFEQFYRCLTGNLFDRVHQVHDINIATDGANADVSFVIHLTAHAWAPPLPRSLHVENQAGFSWKMTRSPATGAAVITSYVLTSIEFPEGSILVEADRVFQYPKFMYGPWGFP